MSARDQALAAMNGENTNSSRNEADAGQKPSYINDLFAGKEVENADNGNAGSKFDFTGLFGGVVQTLFSGNNINALQPSKYTVTNPYNAPGTSSKTLLIIAGIAGFVIVGTTIVLLILKRKK